jgi:UDP-2,3-diacylglucosamine pyrophosphatase LpxH
MHLSFDLISDLHLTSRDYNWTGVATSPICVVAGDVSKDRSIVVDFLTHLSTCYQQVLYIDGNSEHHHELLDLEHSQQDLITQIKKIKNLQYLYDDVVVINGIAFVGTNGWWGFDFDPDVDSSESALFYQHIMSCTETTVGQIIVNSINDAAYLAHTIEKLQTHSDIRQIVIVTHTVPLPELIAHDIELAGSLKFNMMGNSLLDAVRIMDTESKIKTWCFGHYHGSVDQTLHNIRYVNNCQGRPGSNYWQCVYYPKKITVGF